MGSRRRRRGSYKTTLVCPSVCPSVRSSVTFFPRNWLISFFWNFPWSWASIYVEKWRSRIFSKNSYLTLFGQKGPKKGPFGQKTTFMAIPQECYITFFCNFAESWTSIEANIWHIQIFSKKLYLPLFGQKGPKKGSILGQSQHS